jgi:membrane-associated HD superfamily phosphohydrolase
MNKLIKQNAQRPNVYGVIVVFILNHFRGHIFESSTECISLLHVIGLDTPTKITYFYYISFFYQNVLRLDVSVYQTLLMQIVYAGTNLDEKVKCGVFA